jgi:hypothetical protein
VTLAECVHDGLGLEAGHANVRDGPGGLELEVHREEALDLRVREPEALGDLVGASVLERVDVAPDAGVDLERLVVDEAKPRLLLRADNSKVW